MRRDLKRRCLVWCGLVVGLAILLSWSAGCGRAEQAGAAPAEPPPNVLIVVLDALRADKLGCYGFERDTSPAIDALARDPDAVVFRRHYVQGAATKPSTASLFTGQFLFQHGVVLADLGYHNVRIHVAGDSLGWPEEGPYAGIIVTAGSPKIPEALVEQLAPGGRLAIS